MKDYSKMSDTDIANRVLLNLGFKHNQSGYGFDVFLSKESRKDTGEKASKGFRFDPCNNPSDAWQIMDDNHIGIRFVNGEWRADTVVGGYHEYGDKKAFRSAMIVYLMMKDEEK
ncbi:hypothetical protein D3C79_537630 [compost metagenome]